MQAVSVTLTRMDPIVVYIVSANYLQTQKKKMYVGIIEDYIHMETSNPKSWL